MEKKLNSKGRSGSAGFHLLKKTATDLYKTLFF